MFLHINIIMLRSYIIGITLKMKILIIEKNWLSLISCSMKNCQLINLFKYCKNFFTHVHALSMTKIRHKKDPVPIFDLLKNRKL